jgi:hypothetical protein
MSTITSITVNDGEAAPVAHVYTPLFPEKGKANYIRKGATPLDAEALTVSDNQFSSTSGIDIVKTKIQVPETVTDADGVVTVAFFHECNVTFNLPRVGTVQQRKNIRVLMANMLLDAVIVAAVDDREPIY